MALQQFNLIERQALYDVHLHKCFYCSELLMFSEMEIDHIVPEWLVRDTKSFEELRSTYELGDSFDLRGFENVVPCHGRCNNRKSGAVFSKQTTLFYLEISRSQLPKVLAEISRLDGKIRQEKLSIVLAIGLQEGIIHPAEIRQLLLKYAPIPSVRFKLQDIVEFVDRVYKHWIDQEAYDDLLDLTVKTGADDGSGITLNEPESEVQVQVFNCRQYLHYVNKGYYTLTTFDSKMAAYFEKNCRIIEALQVAKIPSTSHLTNLHDYSLIPVCILPSFSPEPEGRIPDYLQLSMQDLIDRKYIRKLERYDNGFSFNYFGQGVIMMELLRADLNSDGVEDMLVWCYNYALGGTLGYGYTIRLTRPSHNSAYELLA